MKKTRLAILLLAFACFAIIGSGSLAFFSSTAKANNVITSGNVKISIVDKDAKGQDFSTSNMEKWLPGQKLVRKFSLLNSGDNIAYVRVKLNMTMTDSDKKVLPTEGKIVMDFNNSDWILKDSWYYYKNPVNKDEQTQNLFTEISFEPTIDNAYQNSDLDMNILVEAVQTANNGAGVLEAKGWPSN